MFDTFQNQSGGFLVTIFANKTPNDPINDPINDPVNDTLNNREQIIKQMTLKNKDVTQEEIAEKCDISLETIKRDMNKMQKANIIKRIGSKKTGHWHINKFD